MTDTTRRPRLHDGPGDDTAPEAANPAQEDAATQAQTFARAARDRAAEPFALPDSEKVGSGDENDDVQDLVDHMRQMDRSGRIDMDAFRGEPDHDDDEA